MNKDESTPSKPTLKSTLTFFNNKLTDINHRRIQINRNKGLARYFAQSQKNLRNLAPLDTTLGVLSFTLYATRLTVNLSLLIQLNLSKETNKKVRSDLYYSLFNDSIWGLVNLTQFFWTSGLQGMQLETLAQLIDIIIMIIRYQQDKVEYDLKYNHASPLEQAQLAIEWQNKELQFMRSLLTSLCMSAVFGLFSFSVAIPFSPLISVIVITSSLLRVLIDNEKDKQLIHLVKLQQPNPQRVIAAERQMAAARLNDLNQIILHSLFLPIGIFLLLTTPLTLTIGASISMLLIHTLISNSITQYSQLNNKELTDAQPLRYAPKSS